MEAQTLPSLRPLRLGELLDQAIRLYRRNFLTFIGIIALVHVPLTILQSASAAVLGGSLEGIARSTSPEEIFTNYAYWGGLFSVIMVGFLQFIFIQGIATGALTRAAADNYLGKPTSILDAYRGIGKSWLTLLGALIIIGFIVPIIMSWWVLVPCVGWFTGLGMLAFLSTAITPMIAPVVVLESPNPRSASTDGIFDRIGKFFVRLFNSVLRAWNLTRRRFWPVLGTIFILYLFNILIVNGPITLVNVLLQQFIPSATNDTVTGVVIIAIVQALVSLVFILLYYPLQMTAFTLIYFDLRVRTEGFDMALLTSNDAEQALMSTPAQSDERLITGPDLGNFAILTFGVLGVYIFLFSIIFGGIFFMSSLFN